MPSPPLYMEDCCKIREIRVPCQIGVDEWEKDDLQALSIDLCFPVAVADAAATDSIVDTVDYRAVADGLFKAFEGRRIRLLETFAESVAQWVLQHTSVAWVDVAVTKTIEKTAAKTATIIIRRERKPQ